MERCKCSAWTPFFQPAARGESIRQTSPVSKVSAQNFQLSQFLRLSFRWSLLSPLVFISLGIQPHIHSPAPTQLPGRGPAAVIIPFALTIWKVQRTPNYTERTRSVIQSSFQINAEILSAEGQEKYIARLSLIHPFDLLPRLSLLCPLPQARAERAKVNGADQRHRSITRSFNCQQLSETTRLPGNAVPNIELKRPEAQGPRLLSASFTFPRKVVSYSAATETAPRRLDCSPPARSEPVSNPRPGHSRILASGYRAVRCQWSVGFLGDFPFPPALCVPVLFHSLLISPFIGYQDLVLESRPKSLASPVARVQCVSALSGSVLLVAGVFNVLVRSLEVFSPCRRRVQCVSALSGSVLLVAGVFNVLVRSLEVFSLSQACSVCVFNVLVRSLEVFSPCRRRVQCVSALSGSVLLVAGVFSVLVRSLGVFSLSQACSMRVQCVSALSGSVLLVAGVFNVLVRSLEVFSLSQACSCVSALSGVFLSQACSCVFNVLVRSLEVFSLVAGVFNCWRSWKCFLSQACSVLVRFWSVLLVAGVFNVLVRSLEVFSLSQACSCVSALSEVFSLSQACSCACSCVSASLEVFSFRRRVHVLVRSLKCSSLSQRVQLLVRSLEVFSLSRLFIVFNVLVRSGVFPWRRVLEWLLECLVAGVQCVSALLKCLLVAACSVLVRSGSVSVRGSGVRSLGVLLVAAVHVVPGSVPVAAVRFCASEVSCRGGVVRSGVLLAARVQCVVRSLEVFSCRSVFNVLVRSLKCSPCRRRVQCVSALSGSVLVAGVFNVLVRSLKCSPCRRRVQCVSALSEVFSLSQAVQCVSALSGSVLVAGVFMCVFSVSALSEVFPCRSVFNVLVRSLEVFSLSQACSVCCALSGSVLLVAGVFNVLVRSLEVFSLSQRVHVLVPLWKCLSCRRRVQVLVRSLKCSPCRRRVQCVSALSGSVLLVAAFHVLVRSLEVFSLRVQCVSALLEVFSLVAGVFNVLVRSLEVFFLVAGVFMLRSLECSPCRRRVQVLVRSLEVFSLSQACSCVSALSGSVLVAGVFNVLVRSLEVFSLRVHVLVRSWKFLLVAGVFSVLVRSLEVFSLSQRVHVLVRSLEVFSLSQACSMCVFNVLVRSLEVFSLSQACSMCYALSGSVLLVAGVFNVLVRSLEGSLLSQACSMCCALSEVFSLSQACQCVSAPLSVLLAQRFNVLVRSLEVFSFAARVLVSALSEVSPCRRRVHVLVRSLEVFSLSQACSCVSAPLECSPVAGVFMCVHVSAPLSVSLSQACSWLGLSGSVPCRACQVSALCLLVRVFIVSALLRAVLILVQACHYAPLMSPAQRSGVRLEFLVAAVNGVFNVLVRSLEVFLLVAGVFNVLVRSLEVFSLRVHVLVRSLEVFSLVAGVFNVLVRSLEVFSLSQACSMRVHVLVRSLEVFPVERFNVLVRSWKCSPCRRRVQCVSALSGSVLLVAGVFSVLVRSLEVFLSQACSSVLVRSGSVLSCRRRVHVLVRSLEVFSLSQACSCVSALSGSVSPCRRRVQCVSALSGSVLLVAGVFNVLVRSLEVFSLSQACSMCVFNVLVRSLEVSPCRRRVQCVSALSGSVLLVAGVFNVLVRSLKCSPCRRRVHVFSALSGSVLLVAGVFNVLVRSLEVFSLSQACSCVFNGVSALSEVFSFDKRVQCVSALSGSVPCRRVFSVLVRSLEVFLSQAVHVISALSGMFSLSQSAVNVLVRLLECLLVAGVFMLVRSLEVFPCRSVLMLLVASGSVLLVTRVQCVSALSGSVLLVAGVFNVFSALSGSVSPCRSGHVLVRLWKVPLQRVHVLVRSLEVFSLSQACSVCVFNVLVRSLEVFFLVAGVFNVLVRSLEVFSLSQACVFNVLVRSLEVFFLVAGVFSVLVRSLEVFSLSQACSMRVQVFSALLEVFSPCRRRVQCVSALSGSVLLVAGVFSVLVRSLEVFFLVAGVFNVLVRSLEVFSFKMTRRRRNKHVTHQRWTIKKLQLEKQQNQQTHNSLNNAPTSRGAVDWFAAGLGRGRFWIRIPELRRVKLGEYEATAECTGEGNGRSLRKPADISGIGRPDTHVRKSG
ncbi:hypothetical protein PR048_032188 [Dryococelus australis]|uniref:Uncharacterized protein n=1 Tax=Dryococelus australis TaxID=614101 RepID=A0ABQ9G1J1_9NEOP|nr:hypothetical protein PR048_032188 [Dryococelus australis]